MVIKTILVDDDKKDLAKIVTKFNSIREPHYEVSYFTDSTDDKIFKSHADLYVFDIDMPNVTGFDLADKINRLNPQAFVIFCSKHDNLVFESFRLNSFFFIRKNHIETDFKNAIDKLNTVLMNRNKHFVYTTSKITRKISHSDIISVEVERNLCTISLIDSQKLILRKTIGALEKELDSNYFLRIQASYIINIQHIVAIKSGKVEMKNGRNYSISRSKHHEVLEAYKLYRIER